MNNSSNRVVVMTLILVVGGGAVLFFGNKFFWQPYKIATNRFNSLTEEVEKKELEYRTFQFNQANAGKWAKLSLQKDFDRAVLDYQKMLLTLLSEHSIGEVDFRGPTPPSNSLFLGAQKKPRHQVLQFVVKAKGTLKGVAEALEALQRMPVMHRITLLDLERGNEKDTTGKVTMQLTIEAMIVNGANSDRKLADSEILLPAATDRKYTEVALRNPFTGLVQPPPPPRKEEPVSDPTDFIIGPDVLQYIVLDTTMVSEQEAFLRNKIFRTSPMRLRPTQGFNTFRIYADEDRNKPLIKCKLLRIDDREIHFQVGDEVHTLRFNESLSDALGKSLSTDRISELELTSLVDPEFSAKTDPAEKNKGKTNPKTAPGGRTTTKKGNKGGA